MEGSPIENDTNGGGTGNGYPEENPGNITKDEILEAKQRSLAEVKKRRKEYDCFL